VTNLRLRGRPRTCAMSSDPRTIYQFSFAPRDDDTVDVWLRLSVEGGEGLSPIGWVTDARTIEVGPTKLSLDQAVATMHHIERALEVLAKAEHSSAAPEQSDVEPTHARPSELRLRR
jgi:hypothetical protein